MTIIIHFEWVILKVVEQYQIIDKDVGVIDCSEEWYIPPTKAGESLGLPSPRISPGRSPREILRGRLSLALVGGISFSLILFLDRCSYFNAKTLKV